MGWKLDNNALNSVGRVSNLAQGVPSSYDKTTSTGETFLIQKGQLNKLRLRPQIINEHAESSREVIATVSNSSNCGQIFKASQDNINGINLTLESAAITSLDDFESYANDAALQAAWASTGDLAILNTEFSAPEGSTQSMELDGSSGVNTEWEETIPATDFTGATGSGYLRFTNPNNQLKLRFYISDGTNSKSAPIVQTGTDIWERIEITEAQLVEDGGGTTDTANITGYGFRLEQRRNSSEIYVDTLVYAPPPGSIELKIFDMGDTLPESGVTKLSDGTQYEKIGDAGISGLQESSLILNLEGGFRNYHIDKFVCGVALEIPTNEVLIPGNYYALYLCHTDTDVSVYGPVAEWGDYYVNGYSFTTPDESAAISATGDSEDIMFTIYSTQEAYINGFQSFINAAPNGNAIASVYVEGADMNRSSVFIAGVKPPQVVSRDVTIPPKLEKGGKIELEYNDDFADSVSQITLIITYFFEPAEVNG